MTDAITVMNADQCERLKVALRDQGFAHHDVADRHRLEGVTLYRFWLPVRATGLSVSLDVQQATDPFHREAVLNARIVSLGDLTIRMVGLEDLVLLKLSAYRPIDRADAIELLTLHRDRLDMDRLRKWAAALDVEDRLQEAIGAAREE